MSRVSKMWRTSLGRMHARRGTFADLANLHVWLCKSVKARRFKLALNLNFSYVLRMTILLYLARDCCMSCGRLRRHSVSVSVSVFVSVSVSVSVSWRSPSSDGGGTVQNTDRGIAPTLE